MNEDNPFLKFQIERQKMLIGKYNNEKNDSLVIPLQKIGEEIVIVVADFKCQKCGHFDELQIHHLITMKAREFLPTHRFTSQRYYWANMVLLCKYCHKRLHHFDADNENATKCIAQARLDEIRQKFGLLETKNEGQN